MSEQYFLKKCITTAEDAKGSYSMMAHLEGIDQEAKQTYDNMLNDIGQHLHYLSNRLRYLEQHNKSGD